MSWWVSPLGWECLNSTGRLFSGPERYRNLYRIGQGWNGLVVVSLGLADRLVLSPYTYIGIGTG